MDRRIVLDESTLEWIYGNFTKQFRRSPTDVEMNALINAHIIGEVKYRHALEMGLDAQDSIIQRRMIQKFDFLFGNAAADSLPDDAVLQEWYDAHPEEFMSPDTVSFSHHYFSPDARTDAGKDATDALVGLQQNDEPESDLFPFEVEFEDATWAEVRNVLGPEFTQEVFDAPIDVWAGPIPSGLGFHLVHVSRIAKGEQPSLGEIRDAVLEGWRESKSDRILQELVDELAGQFEVTIDEESLSRFEYSLVGEAIAP